MLVPSSVWQPMIQKLDLRTLCTIILEKTINDPDKYQNGLTKIFFRAGMLAALESLRSDKLNYLVTVVQKNMRRRMAVKKYHNLRQATIKIQTWWRGIMAKRLVEHIRREAAAKRLQTALRRFVQRQKFVTIRRAITLFQSRKSDVATWPGLQSIRCAWYAGSTTLPRKSHYSSSNSYPEYNSWSVSMLLNLHRRR